MSHKRTRVTHMNLLVIGLSVLFCLAVLVAAGYLVSTRTQPVQAAAEPVSLVAEGNVKTGTLNQDPEKRQEELNHVVEEGMLTSNEPGIYIEGSHGIRTENLLLCRKAEKNGYGQFMRFETMTYAPIDTEAIDISVMEPSDVRLLNQYHKDVYEKLSPYLTKEEAEWLKDATKPIGGDAQWHI